MLPRFELRVLFIACLVKAELSGGYRSTEESNSLTTGPGSLAVSRHLQRPPSGYVEVMDLALEVDLWLLPRLPQRTAGKTTESGQGTLKG